MNAYLPISIEFGPVVIQRLLRQISLDQMDRQMHPGRFTPREVVAHLADWEPIMRERIRQAVTNPGSTLVVYDEDQMAIENRYSKSDPNEQCALFARERSDTAEYIKTLSQDDLRKTVHHPERGERTADDLANLLLGHDLYHIEQLSEYLT